jgi:hypothetical protein
VRQFLHQLAEILALEVNEMLMITRLDVDIGGVFELIIPDHLQPIGLAERRYGARFAVLEELLEFRFRGQPQVALQFFVDPAQVQAVVRRQHADDVALVVFQNDGFGHLVRRHMG